MTTYRQPFKNEWPITQYYGEKITSNFHTGIDYGCPFGTSILASSDGVVVFAKWDNTGYGNMVIVQHSKSCSTCYAHLSDISVVLNQKVRQGQLLGHSGSTGNSTGPHLHFEARNNWNDYKSHFNPMLLPLTSVYDEAPSKSLLSSSDLKPGDVEIVCTSGAFVHSNDFSAKQVFPKGSVLTFTGKSQKKNGIDFCQCVFWVAANDGETQILKNI